MIVVECGWPRSDADVVTYGGSPVVARALGRLLGVTALVSEQLLLGIDIGGTKTAVAAVTRERRGRSPLRSAPSGRGEAQVVEVAVRLAREVADSVGGLAASARSGPACPGLVDPRVGPRATRRQPRRRVARAGGRADPRPRAARRGRQRRQGGGPRRPPPAPARLWGSTRDARGSPAPRTGRTAPDVATAPRHRERSTPSPISTSAPDSRRRSCATACSCAGSTAPPARSGTCPSAATCRARAGRSAASRPWRRARHWPGCGRRPAAAGATRSLRPRPATRWQLPPSTCSATAWASRSSSSCSRRAPSTSSSAAG